MTGCNKNEQRPLSKEEIQYKIDSITNIRIRELDAMSLRDLNHRIKIEVKIKADSLLNLKMTEKARKDSVVRAREEQAISTETTTNTPQ